MKLILRLRGLQERCLTELNVCDSDYGDLLRSPEMPVLIWLTDYRSICLDEEIVEYLTQVSRSPPICDSNS